MNDLQTFETGTATVGESATVQNPFGAPLAQGGASNISTAQIVSREVAEMQAQIYLAKQFPRDQRQATDRILTACQRPGLASVAVYAYSRGGSNISGPSIRLAEEIARNWCNIECGWNEMERLDDMSKVRAFAWDKETNVLKTLFFFVPHYRSTKKGRNRITDERDLYELLANSAARRMRNCVLALIPGDVVDAAVEQCQKTMISKCDVTPEGLLRLVESFESFGVTKRAIEARLGRRIDAIAPAQYLRLREIYASLRDGMSEPSDWFEPTPEADAAPSATEKVKAALATKKTLSASKSAKSKSAKTPSNDAASSDVPHQTPEPQTPPVQSVSVGGGNGELFGAAPFETFRKRLVDATSFDELQAVSAEIDGACRQGDLTDDEREALFDVFDQRSQAFEFE